MRVLIELARHLDMHPADLVYELDAVLSNRREPVTDPFAPPSPDDEATDTDPQADAMTLLVAPATAPAPVTADALTRALGWRLPRTHAALRHLHDHPRLGGPMALRRVPPDAYTLTPRLDVLDREQHQALTQPRVHRDILAEAHAAALHTVITLGYRDGYLQHPSRNPIAEHHLEQAGLIRRGDTPGTLYAHEDVLFSLRCTGNRYSRRWAAPHRRRREHPGDPAQPPPPPPPAEPLTDHTEDDVADLTEYDHPPADPAGR